MVALRNTGKSYDGSKNISENQKYATESMLTCLLTDKLLGPSLKPSNSYLRHSSNMLSSLISQPAAD